MVPATDQTNDLIKTIITGDKKMAIQVGQRIQIKAGTRVRDLQTDITTTRQRDSIVTVRKVEKARNNKVRVYWKSSNYQTALV